MLQSHVTFLAPHPLDALLRNSGFSDSSGVAELSYPHQDVREPDVFSCPSWFWVVVRDQRPQFADELRIEKCQPYRWTGDVGEGPSEGYGWLDAGGNTRSNAFASVAPLDDYQVILVKPV